MTEHKFTDDEIIRALECCINPNGANCKECPYDICCTVVESIMLTDVLNLINRQKAEIERIYRHTEMYHEVRAEAIKEFAERLKEKIRVMDRIIIYGEDIDNLVKEMTEGI